MSEEFKAGLIGAIVGALFASFVWFMATRPPSGIPPIELSSWDFDCYETHVEKYGTDPILSREVCDAWVRDNSPTSEGLAKLGVFPVVLKR